MPQYYSLTMFQQGSLINQCYTQLTALQIDIECWYQRLHEETDRVNYPSKNDYYYTARLKFGQNIGQLYTSLKDYQAYWATYSHSTAIQEIITQLEQNGPNIPFEDVILNLKDVCNQTGSLPLLKDELLQLGKQYLDQLIVYSTDLANGQRHLPEDYDSIRQQLPELINSVLFLQGFASFPPICYANAKLGLFHFTLLLINETYGIPPESMQLTADKLALGEHLGEENLIQHIQQQNKRLNDLEPSSHLTHATIRLADEYKLFVDPDETNEQDLLIDENQINPNDCVGYKSKETASTYKKKYKVRVGRQKTQLLSLQTAFSLLKQKDLIEAAPTDGITLKWLNFLCSSKLQKQGYVAQIAALMSSTQATTSDKRQTQTTQQALQVYDISLRFITSFFYWGNSNNASLSKFFIASNPSLPEIDHDDWDKAQTLYGRIEAIIDLHNQTAYLPEIFFKANADDYTHLQSAQSCLSKEFQLFQNQYEDLEQDRKRGISYKPESEVNKYSKR